MHLLNRRQWLQNLSLSPAILPFLSGLPSASAAAARPGQRLIIMFSPNGTLPQDFWPDQQGRDFQFKSILKPLEPFKKRSLILNGIHNQVRGDGDSHMRGMSCLLTGAELLPGNIRGGGGSPAGWASNISIDQEIKNYLQSQPERKTRFGSLEFGVAVPNRADPWTRMSYAGPNQPVAPIDDPHQMLAKLYGKMKDKESLVSVLDAVRQDLKQVSNKLSSRDKQLLDQHLDLVRSLETDLLEADKQTSYLHPIPDVDPTIELVNDNTPAISRIQINLLVNAMANNMASVATLQFMRSVGMAQMRWLGIEEGHHSLSHDPDSNEASYKKLLKINQWFAGEFAFLAKRLSETPEPNGDGSMLDHTLILWTNELGKGNSHTLNDIPCVMIGGEKSFGYQMGRSLQFEKQPHNRLLLSLAHSFGHTGLQSFGNTELSAAGPLDLRSDLPSKAS